jgi:hypothetical protein
MEQIGLSNVNGLCCKYNGSLLIKLTALCLYKTVCVVHVKVTDSVVIIQNCAVHFTEFTIRDCGVLACIS